MYADSIRLVDIFFFFKKFSIFKNIGLYLHSEGVIYSQNNLADILN